MVAPVCTPTWPERESLVTLAAGKPVPCRRTAVVQAPADPVNGSHVAKWLRVSAPAGAVRPSTSAVSASRNRIRVRRARDMHLMVRPARAIVQHPCPGRTRSSASMDP